MKITLLGTGTCHQQKDRSTTAINCAGWGTHFLIDIGSGALRRMAENNISMETVEALFLTHVHPDHLTDFPALIQQYFTQRPNPRGKTLYVFGPPGTEKAVWGLLQIMMPSWYDSFPFRIDVKEVKNSAIEFGKIRVEAREVDHIPGEPSIGYRFSYNDKSFAFSGDTGMCSGLKKIAKDTDVFISECNNPNELAAKCHMSPAEIAVLANEVKAKEIVLTHIGPECEGHDLAKEAAAFSGEITVAEDMMELKL